MISRRLRLDIARKIAARTGLDGHAALAVIDLPDSPWCDDVAAVLAEMFQPLADSVTRTFAELRRALDSWAAALRPAFDGIVQRLRAFDESSLHAYASLTPGQCGCRGPTNTTTSCRADVRIFDRERLEYLDGED